MNALLNNPYNEVLNPNLDFSDGYFDAVVGNVKNKDMLLALLKGCNGEANDENVDFLWNFLPIDAGFKVGCKVEEAKNVLRYLIKKVA
ncbi:hypothetical protein JC221_256 [Yersinia phage JC221]|nr:hypothetical protein JC221_256 [Yersinia phage JC221]